MDEKLDKKRTYYREYMKKWRLTEKGERIAKQAQKKWYEKNKEKIFEHQKIRNKTQKYRNYHRLYKVKYRSEHPENRLKDSARSLLNYAIKIGNIVREPCIECGNVRSQGHHHNYLKPLEVIWLCQKHHRRLHMQLK